MSAKNALPIAAVLASAAPAVIINTPGAYIPLVFLLLLCLVSLLYTLISALFVSIDAEPPELLRYERESSACCSVTVNNRGILPLPCVSVSLCIKSFDGFPTITSEHLVMLRPRQRLTLTLPVSFPHIGRYELRVSRLRFYGFLGFPHIDKKPRWAAPVHVTPKLYDMPGLSLHTTQAVMAVDFNMPNKISGGEYSDVRQYEPGDPLKNIHWKLSAHSSDYITRLFKTDAVSGVSVYIDFRLPSELHASAADINDRAAESAYSAAARALRQNYHVELVYSQMNMPVSARPKDQTELMAAAYSLPPVSAKERYPIELLVAEHSGRLLSPDNVIVITADDGARLTDVLSDLKRRGKRASLCRIGDDGWALEEVI